MMVTMGSLDSRIVGNRFDLQKGPGSLRLSAMQVRNAERMASEIGRLASGCWHFSMGCLVELDQFGEGRVEQAFACLELNVVELFISFSNNLDYFSGSELAVLDSIAHLQALVCRLCSTRPSLILRLRCYSHCSRFRFRGILRYPGCRLICSTATGAIS